MEAFKRDTRVKLAHNPTGELIKILTPCIIKKIAVKLRAFRAAAVGLIFALTSCTPELIVPPTCESGDCDAYIEFYREKDSNGYYHVELDWTGEYLPYFYVDAFAEKTHPHWYYNDASVVQARFTSNTSWVIGDTLVIQQVLYDPFGLVDQDGIPLPAGYNDLNLTQFEGIEVNIAQSAPIYFHDKPEGFKTRRYLGPFIPQMIGDTITVHMQVYWDAGMESKVKDHYLEKFIVE